MNRTDDSQDKANRDNHSNQMNPNNSAYESSRQGNQQDDDYPDMEKLCDSDD
jgi:hypothetical protein